MDWSPQKAFQVYENNDLDFILLDVCDSEFKRTFDFKGSLKIPLEDLSHRYAEIQNS